MLPGMTPARTPFTGYGLDAFEIVTRLGLTTGLQMCHDAGDAASLPAASDTYNDLTAAALHFFLGSGTGADAADPSINGTAGGLSDAEYLGFDGGDYLTLNQANPAWIDRLHQDSAKFGMLFLIDYVASSTVMLCGTNGGNLVNTGIHFFVNTGNTVAFRARNAGAQVADFDRSLTVSAGPALVGFSLDEAAGTGFAYVNGTQSAFTGGTYSSPSAGAATFALQLAARANGNLPAASGTKFYADWFWEGVAPTKAQYDAVFNAVRGRVEI